ncbi:flavin monoamine oxidase family protein [Streptomyces sp. NPDC007945]|uniref:flavin monoamine oxidase family protein n=1 Tax=Streptomyces sp. NPDC007945 TaxID=3364797 RepID=UPI0036F030F0
MDAQHSDAQPVLGEDTEATAGGWDRRGFLKRAGAVGAMAAAGMALSGTATSAAAKPTGTPVEPDPDILVIGAGFAGLAAARHLRGMGFQNVEILEARGRIGGRTWTDTLQGKQIELGAGWFHPSQSHIQTALRKYGIGIVYDDPMDAVLAQQVDGTYRQYDVGTAFETMGNLYTKFFQGTQTFLPNAMNPLQAKDLIAAQDAYTAADRYAQIGMTAEEKAWIGGTLAGYAGLPSTGASWTSLAQWWGLGGYDANGWFNLTSQKPATGMIGLAQAMLNEANHGISYNQNVVRISDPGTTGSQVSVTTAQNIVYRAKAVVCAVPTNVWNNITFTYGIPQAFKDAATEGLGVPHAVKIWMYVRGPQTRTLVQSKEGSKFESMVPMHKLPDGQLMIAFGGAGLTLDKATLNAETKKILGSAYEVVDFKVADWGHDPYARGGWSLRRPKQLLRHLPALQQPVGRIAFANDGLASGWNGFIEGAIESGINAAIKAAEASGMA